MEATDRVFSPLQRRTSCQVELSFEGVAVSGHSETPVSKGVQVKAGWTAMRDAVQS